MRKDVRVMRRRRPQGWGSLLVALLLLLVLAPIVAHADDITLSWTAPGDDGNVGTATSYELRMSTTQLTSANFSTTGTVVATAAPLISGSRQTTLVTNLTNGTVYWFAIKTTDDVGNQSLISNVVRWDWVLDTAPPAAPSGVSAARQSSGTVRVAWSANTEPDLNGYNVYRALNASGPFTALNGSPVSATNYTDSGVPTGTAMVWYQVSAQDATGNVSARSSTFALDMTATTAAADAWSMETGYPNPSPAGTTVRLPLVAPSSGGTAALEIVNDVGQRVRWLDLGSVSPGAMEVPWDGHNDGGREVAPGVYTVWLVTGGTRLSARLVRVP